MGGRAKSNFLESKPLGGGEGKRGEGKGGRGRGGGEGGGREVVKGGTMENYRNTIKILSAPPWEINNGLSLRPAEIFGQLSFRTITRQCKLLAFDDFVSSRFKLISRGFLSVLSELKSKKIF